MTQANRKATLNGNGLESGQDSSGHAEGQFVHRMRRRRLDLSTLHGTLRESARVYRELAEGDISMVEADVRSRVLRRHSDILTAVEQGQQIRNLQEQLERIQSHPGTPALPDFSALPQSEPVAEGGSPGEPGEVVP